MFAKMHFTQALWLAAFLCQVHRGLQTVPTYSGDTKDLCTDSSVRISNVGETGTIYADLSINNADHDNPCIMKIETCSACQIEISPAPMDNFEFYCRTGQLENAYCSLGCDYLHIFDMYYMNETKTAKFYKKWSDFDEPFVSESSNIFIMLCHGNSGRYNFTLHYKTIKKMTVIDGTYADPNTQTGVLTSPFFPRGYYLNHEVYVYVIEGLQETDRIKLVFTDWHLDTSSALYYEDGYDEGSFTRATEGSFTGASLRPSIVTENNKLRFTFHTGEALSPAYGRNYMGFKAVYSFHSSLSTIHKPTTNCKNSGYFMKENGGHFKFTYSTVQRQLYDCVWVVKRQPGYTGIYLKITTLKMIGSSKGGRIIVRSGLTSDSPVIGNISVFDDIGKMLPFRKPEGFYVQLVATLSSSDSVEMAYASYKDTSICHREPGLFECRSSRRCISNTLTCDGYDHCGDNSDENKACGVFTPEYDQSYQYTITIGVIVPMVISVFLVMVICLLFVLIRRCRRQRMEDSRSSDRVRTLSEDVSPSRGNRRRRRRRRRLFNANTDQDNPPPYDEAIQSPPSWYLNVGFSTPVDPNVPQPPPYSELPDGQSASMTNPVPGSPVSSHSSQSEVTIDSRRHSVSSSSSDGGFRDWGSPDGDREGRRGRLGRHVSSSDDSDDDDGISVRVSRVSSSGHHNDAGQTGTSSIVYNQQSVDNNKRKTENKTSGDKDKPLNVKDKTIGNVVDTNDIDDRNKVGAEVKQGNSNDSNQRRNTSSRGSDVAVNSNSPVKATVPASSNRVNSVPNEPSRHQAHAGMRNHEGNNYDRNIVRPTLTGQRQISRSEGNLARNRDLAVVGMGDGNVTGTRHSIAGHDLPGDDFSGNIVVDVDTNEVRIVYNGADEYRDNTHGSGHSNRPSPQRYHSRGVASARSEGRRVSPSGNRDGQAAQAGQRNEDNMRMENMMTSSVPNISAQGPEGREIGRTTSVNYIPLFIDGNQEEDIYV